MKFIASFLVVALVVCAMALTADAQLIVDPSAKAEAGQMEVGDALTWSQTDYDPDGGDEGYIERLTLGAYGAYGLTDMLDLYGSAGYIIMAEPEDAGDDGNGFIVALGARAALMQMDAMTVHAYGQIQHIMEDYGEESDPLVGNIEFEGTITELVLGAVANYAVADAMNIYGGLELVPMSDGEVEVEGDAIVDADFDIERDNMIGVRGGATYDFGNFWVRGEASFLTETSVSIGGGLAF